MEEWPVRVMSLRLSWFNPVKRISIHQPVTPHNKKFCINRLMDDFIDLLRFVLALILTEMLEIIQLY